MAETIDPLAGTPQIPELAAQETVTPIAPMRRRGARNCGAGHGLHLP